MAYVSSRIENPILWVCFGSITLRFVPFKVVVFFTSQQHSRKFLRPFPDRSTGYTDFYIRPFCPTLVIVLVGSGSGCKKVSTFVDIWRGVLQRLSCFFFFFFFFFFF
jgi:hypothetical protein